MKKSLGCNLPTQKYVESTVTPGERRRRYSGHRKRARVFGIVDVSRPLAGDRDPARNNERVPGAREQISSLSETTSWNSRYSRACRGEPSARERRREIAGIEPVRGGEQGEESPDLPAV